MPVMLLQTLLSAGAAILGALIGGLTLLKVAERNLNHASELDVRRSRLAKGEELVAVLSELASWRARNAQELHDEISRLETQLNRGYALAITYYGDVEGIASTFYSEGLALLEKLTSDAVEYVGMRP